METSAPNAVDAPKWSVESGMDLNLALYFVEIIAASVSMARYGAKAIASNRS